MDCVCYYLQVASVFVYRIHHNYVFPRYIDGLAACLIKHLELDLEDVNFAVYRQNQKAVGCVWYVKTMRYIAQYYVTWNTLHILAGRSKVKVTVA